MHPITEELASVKKGIIQSEDDFRETMKNFTMYFSSLRTWINRLRKVVFPDRER